MILPPRGKAVDREARRELLKLLTPEYVLTRCQQLKSTNELRLHDVFSDADVHRRCAEWYP